MMRPQDNPLDGRGQSDSGQRRGLSAKANGKIAPASATDEWIFRIPVSMLANETVLLVTVVGGCCSHPSMQRLRSSRVLVLDIFDFLDCHPKLSRIALGR
jgi:hypothetical protein